MKNVKSKFFNKDISLYYKQILFQSRKIQFSNIYIYIYINNLFIFKYQKKIYPYIINVYIKNI